MNMAEIKEMAIQYDIKPGKMKKGDLVRAIQTKEGNSPCFQTATDFCDQTTCLWKSDCLTH